MTKAELIAAIAAARQANDTALVAELEAQLKELEASAKTETPANAPATAEYPTRTRERGELATIRTIEVGRFTSSNGKPKVARIILREPVSIAGYPRPVGVIFVSKKQADKLCAAARVRNIEALADFVAFGDGTAHVDLDVLVDEDGNEAVLPASIELHSSVKRDLRAITMRSYERSMASVAVDAFTDEPAE